MKIWSFGFLFALLSCGIISETSAAPLELITASEAAKPDLSIPKGGVSGEPSGFHGISPMPGGPKIIVEKPEEGSSVPTPFPVRIRFIPSQGARINLQSLEICRPENDQDFIALAGETIRERKRDQRPRSQGPAGHLQHRNRHRG